MRKLRYYGGQDYYNLGLVDSIHRLQVACTSSGTGSCDSSPATRSDGPSSAKPARGAMMVANRMGLDRCVN